MKKLKNLWSIITNIPALLGDRKKVLLLDAQELVALETLVKRSLRARESLYAPRELAETGETHEVTAPAKELPAESRGSFGVTDNPKVISYRLWNRLRASSLHEPGVTILRVGYTLHNQPVYSVQGYCVDAAGTDESRRVIRADGQFSFEKDADIEVAGDQLAALLERQLNVIQ
jgi:hypothetical protein